MEFKELNKKLIADYYISLSNGALESAKIFVNTGNLKLSIRLVFDSYLNILTALTYLKEIYNVDQTSIQPQYPNINDHPKIIDIWNKNIIDSNSWGFDSFNIFFNN